jgi:uncharacterized protein (TIGR02246 family)
MRRLLIRFTVLCSITTPACRTSGEQALTPAERTAITDSIVAVAHGMAQAANALDADALDRTLASDPELTWASDGHLLAIPHDSMMAMYRNFYHSLRSMAFVWDTLRVSVLGHDAAVLSGAAHFAVTDTSNQTDREAVAVTYVFVRRDQRWQLLHGHASHRPLRPSR